MPWAWDISSDQLETWAGSYAAASVLPKLVRRLLAATAPLASVEARADAGVRLGGFDVLAKSREQTPYCPRGTSAWELSTAKDVKTKLDEDFDRRTGDPPQGIDPANTVYIAVTARRYPAKKDWVRQKRGVGAWRDVELYDADDLATFWPRSTAQPIAACIRPSSSTDTRSGGSTG